MTMRDREDAFDLAAQYDQRAELAAIAGDRALAEHHRRHAKDLRELAWLRAEDEALHPAD